MIPAPPRRPRRKLRVLIASGPTREPIDPVRFISNHSTGFMGVCLANACLARGHTVTVVSGPGCLPFAKGVDVIAIEQSRELDAALRRRLAPADVLIMAAAVCDFRPRAVSRRKLSRRDGLTLSLVATPDILAGLPRRRGQVVVGFALETADAMAHATQKRRSKRVDLIVGQRIAKGASPFGDRPLDAFLVDRIDRVTRLGVISKPRLARAILDKIEHLWYGDVPRSTPRIPRRAVRRGRQASELTTGRT